MLHLVHEGALQADHIGGQCVIEDLAAPVVQHLVTKCPAAEHRIEMLTARTFSQETRAGVDAQFVDLECFHECKFFSGEFAQARPLAQRALLARRIIAVWPSVSDDHENSYVAREIARAPDY